MSLYLCLDKSGVLVDMVKKTSLNGQIGTTPYLSPNPNAWHHLTCETLNSDTQDNCIKTILLRRGHLSKVH